MCSLSKLENFSQYWRIGDVWTRLIIDLFCQINLCLSDKYTMKHVLGI